MCISCKRYWKTWTILAWNF